MNLLTSRLLSGIALIMALGLTASHAYAQRGAFNLPFEVRWGSVVLPPGSYRVSIPMQVARPQIINISGQGKSVWIGTAIEAPQPRSGHSYLLLSNIDGTQVVREFHSGVSGQVFTFLMPKTIEKKLADLRKVPTTRLPIGASAQ